MFQNLCECVFFRFFLEEKIFTQEKIGNFFQPHFFYYSLRIFWTISTNFCRFLVAAFVFDPTDGSTSDKRCNFLQLLYTYYIYTIVIIYNLILNHTNYVSCKGLKIYNAICSLVLGRWFLIQCAIPVIYVDDIYNISYA